MYNMLENLCRTACCNMTCSIYMHIEVCLVEVKPCQATCYVCVLVIDLLPKSGLKDCSQLL